MNEVTLQDRLAVTIEKIIHGDWLVASIYYTQKCMATDITGTASNKDHFRRPQA